MIVHSAHKTYDICCHVPATSPRPSPPVSPVKPNCLILRPPRPGEPCIGGGLDDDATGRRLRCEEEIREWLRGVPVEVLDNLIRRLLDDVEVPIAVHSIFDVHE